MALMFTQKEFDYMPDAAIFADTQWEPVAVYDWLDWLETQLSYPVYRVSAGSLRNSVIAMKTREARFISIPAYTDTGIGKRQCTSEFKIDPIKKKYRQLLGYEKGQRIPFGSCTSLVGISLDEASRMKISADKWIQNRYPLIERGMNRYDCLNWMKKNGYPAPPRSSCIGCPFHNDHEWRKIKGNPTEWEDAVEVDEIIRASPGMKQKQYLHRSRIPLKYVDLSTPEEKGQLNLFENECEGLCGV